jgi:hypothetical protein
MLEADVTVRLEILKVLIPSASRVGIQEPDNLIEISRKLEKYVIDSDQTDAVTPDASGKRTLGLPRKEKRNPDTPAFLTPPNGGQVESSPR